MISGRAKALAIGVSVLLHGAALWTMADTRVKADAPEAEQAVRVRVNLAPPPVQPPPPEPEVVPEPPPEPDPEIIPEPPPEPEPPPPPPPKPKPKPKPQPKPKPKPPPRPQPPPVEVPPPVSVAPAPAEPPVDIDAVKSAYMTRILELIEAQKQYPRTARRRRVEGRIRIRFQVLADGGIEGLAVEGRHSALERAARAAVEKSLPLPPVPAALGAGFDVVCAMEFKLK